MDVKFDATPENVKAFIEMTDYAGKIASQVFKTVGLKKAEDATAWLLDFLAVVKPGLVQPWFSDAIAKVAGLFRSAE